MDILGTAHQSVDLQKIAADLNDSISEVSKSLTNYVGHHEERPKQTLTLPSQDKFQEDEEVAIEVEYMGDAEDVPEESESKSSTVESTSQMKKVYV